MKPVARYNARGPFGNRVVILRHTEGAQLWTVRVQIERNGVIDQHEIESKARIDLSAMTSIVFDSIKEMLGEHETVEDAKMEFFIR